MAPNVSKHLFITLFIHASMGVYGILIATFIYTCM